MLAFSFFFQTYLKTHSTRKNQVFIITVSEYSYAILKSVNGIFHFFDSHGKGHANFRGKILSPNASIISFDNRQNLIKFLHCIHGEDTQIDIGELEVDFGHNGDNKTEKVPAEEVIKSTSLDSVAPAVMEEVVITSEKSERRTEANWWQQYVNM